MSTSPKSAGDNVTISTDTFTRMDDARMRLARIERDMKQLEDDVREQGHGSQDGYLIEVAARIRGIMA